jgi:hypothetical protein
LTVDRFLEAEQAFSGHSKANVTWKDNSHEKKTLGYDISGGSSYLNGRESCGVGFQCLTPLLVHGKQLHVSLHQRRTLPKPTLGLETHDQATRYSQTGFYKYLKKPYQVLSSCSYEANVIPPVLLGQCLSARATSQ